MRVAFHGGRSHHRARCHENHGTFEVRRTRRYTVVRWGPTNARQLRPADRLRNVPTHCGTEREDRPLADC
jgi:hypothetical protein